MPWFDTHEGSKVKENWRQLNPRAVVCAPREDLPFWKARLESLGIDRVDLHHTRRDAWNELHHYLDSSTDPDWFEPADGVYWDMIMLLDNKVEWTPDVSDKSWSGEGGCNDCHASVLTIGDLSSKKVTYKSSDQKIVDLLTEGFNDLGCCWRLHHVYEPNRLVKKGNL